MTTLTDRYVAATLARTPSQQRDDVEADLRAAIADAIDARLDAGDFADAPDPAWAAETAVLNEMGDPDRLAADYAERPLTLIGPRLYLQWRRLTVLLLWIVVPIVGAAALLGSWLAGDSAWAIVGQTLGAIWITGIMLVFWVTVVFAVIERASQEEIDSMTTSWTVERLPEVTQARIPLADTVGAAVTLVLTAAAIIWQQLAPWAVDGTAAPIIDPSLWSFVLPALLALMAVELVTVIVRHVRGHWTWGDWWACLAVNVAVLALLAPSLLGGTFLNPEFFAAIGWPDDATDITVDQVSVVLYAIIAVCCAVDVVAGLRRARLTP